MSILPILKAGIVLRKLSRVGFKIHKIKGSHYILRNLLTGRTTSVPLHGGKDIGRNLLIEILKQAGITIKEFLKY